LEECKAGEEGLLKALESQKEDWQCAMEGLDLLHAFQKLAGLGEATDDIVAEAH